MANESDKPLKAQLLKADPDALPEGVRLVAELPSTQAGALAFSADGKYLATGSTELGGGPEIEVVNLWDAATGQPARTIRGRWRFFKPHREAISAMALSADGRLLATGDSCGGLCVWNFATGKSRWWSCRVQGSRILSLAFLAGGELLAVGSRRRLETPMLGWSSFVDELGVRRVSNGKLVRPLRPEYMSALAAPASGTHYATSGDGLIRLWKLESSTPWSQLKGHQSQVNAVAFSPDGRLMASGSEDRTTIVWSPASGEVLATLRFSDSVRAVAFSPRGKYLASLAHRLVLWDATTRAVKLSISGVRDYQRLAFSPDGKTLAVSGEAGVRMWEIAGLKG